MGIARVKAPLSVVVREVAYQNDVVCLLTRGTEISVEHNARARTGWVDRGSIMPGEIEALDDYVMSCAQQEHPVRI
jgi:hypothetical protein